jgi:hypothetical protein
MTRGLLLKYALLTGVTRWWGLRLFCLRQ